MPKPNPKQAAELIANLQKAMCRRQEAAEARHRTHHVAALLCRMGGAARRARWASARALSCAVGRSRAGEARLEVSNNAREYSADSAWRSREALLSEGGARARKNGARARF